MKLKILTEVGFAKSTDADLIWYVIHHVCKIIVKGGVYLL